MQTNRRNWLKQISIAAAGVTIAPLKNFALPPNKQLPQRFDKMAIRLSSNENPYGPSALALHAIKENAGITNRYNWQLTSELVDAIATKNNVTADNVLMGAGSTEILDVVVRYSALKKGNFIVADPTYNYWCNTAETLGLKKILVPLKENKQHNLLAMLNAINANTKLIYLCNPNNPTGTICDRNELVNFVEKAAAKTLVLIDEAYIDFTTQQSLSGLVLKNKNIIIAKTFSKIYGLAGARVGYAVAHTQTIEKLSTLQSWVNGSVSVPSVAGALAAIKDEDFVKEVYKLNEQVKEYTIEQLELLQIKCISSYSNFIYFSLVNYNKDFFEQLKKANVIGTKIYEEKGKWSRITVGTMQEMQAFIEALK